MEFDRTRTETSVKFLYQNYGIFLTHHPDPGKTSAFMQAQEKTELNQNVAAHKNMRRNSTITPAT
jgi:hypothetical protein